MNYTGTGIDFALMKFEPLKFYLLAINKYFIFNGRARRKELWYFVSINLFIFFSLFLLRVICLDQATKHIIDYVIAAFCMLTVAPTISLTVRRLHDTGRPGWIFALNLIPVIGTIIFTVFMMTDSMIGYNEYGEYPKFSPMPQ